MDSDTTDDKNPTRGPNFAKNRRPASSKRVTFALGTEGQEQADRLARILSIYRKGGVSQSAVVRGLLQFAESIALESGDPAVRPMFENPSSSGSVSSTEVGKPNAEATLIWERVRSKILDA